MTAPDYLLIGHVTADLRQGERVLGGTVSYAAGIAHALGHSVAVLTSCAVDEPLVQPLRSLGALHVIPAEQTTTFENIYEGDQRRQTLHAWANVLYAQDIPQTWLTAPVVHLAPVAAELDASLFAAFPHSTILLTPQGLMRRWDASGVVSFRYWCDAALLRYVSVVVFSRQDVQAMPEIAAQYAAAVPHVVVTDGANGGVYYHDGVPRAYRAYPAHEADPTGAGDVFATTLVAMLGRVGGDVDRALDAAARLAALVVQHHGVYIPSASDIAAAGIAGRVPPANQ
jgi:sugar/nucleoside kinase (ribokinase family)